MKEYIIDDSSRHNNPNSLIGKDYSIRIGTVREHIYLTGPGQTRYIVEVWKDNKLYPMTCIRTNRFGGLYNYEEFNHRGFNVGQIFDIDIPSCDQSGDAGNRNETLSGEWMLYQMKHMIKTECDRSMSYEVLCTFVKTGLEKSNRVKKQRFRS